MTTPRHKKFGYELTDKDKFRYFSKIFALYESDIKRYWEKTQSEDWDDVEVLPESFRIDYLDNQFDQDYEENCNDEDEDEHVPFEIELHEKDLLSENYKRILDRAIEVRKKEHPDEDEETLFANTIEELAEEYGPPWLKLHPPANQLPGKKYKTITDAQLAGWEWDEDHMINIEMPKKHLLAWFDNVEFDEDEEDDFSFGFEKYDKDTLLITEFNPDFWTECSQEDFEKAVLDRLHLKKEWIESMTVDG